jgi:hypothetical protein
MANDLRGSVTIAIDGESYEVGLSIGTMMELATAWDTDDYAVLNERLQKMAPRDVPVILNALLAGNGHAVSETAIRRVAPDAFYGTMRQIFELAAKRAKASGAEVADANPPERRRRSGSSSAAPSGS